MLRAALALSLVAAAPLVALACSDGSTPAANASDEGADAPADVVLPDTFTPPNDSGVSNCKLRNGTDPVLLCFQKTLLSRQADAVFADGVGVYASWDSTSLEPDKADGGQPLHDWHDDVAFAAAIASYQASALVYADSQFTASFDALLLKLEAIIEKEMSPLPAEYGGDVYRQLRIIADALRRANGFTQADRIDAIADAYGRAILSFSQPVSAMVDGGDAGAMQSVLGTTTTGGVAYAPLDVTTGAFALIDMAHRHLANDATFAASAQAAAVRALDYVWSRGRDPATGMFYAALVTSGDPGHDALAPSTGAPSDALLLEVEAAIALNLARAQAFVSMPSSGLTAAVTGYPFDVHASAIVDATNGPTSLWDGLDAPDAGTGGGYFEGYVPSTSALVTTKPSRGNAFMYAALHRLLPDVGGNYPWQGKFLRPILTTPAPPLNAGLYSVVSGQSGYFRATTSDFKIATETRGASYTSRAVASVCEALNELWYGFHM